VKLPDSWSRADAVFDDEHLVSCAGLVPVMGLAERTGLSELIAERVGWKTCRVASAGVNPAGKLSAVVAGMAVGADCIDDLDVIRCGGMRRLFGGVSRRPRWARFCGSSSMERKWSLLDTDSLAGRAFRGDRGRLRLPVRDV
jgi:hypothetical protein